jgi:hypothetical protein
MTRVATKIAACREWAPRVPEVDDGQGDHDSDETELGLEHR